MSSLPEQTPEKPRRARREKSAQAFRTISEVAEELGVQQHVLRFWETRFNQIKPMKRGGGRRYYRPEDVTLLKGIRKLLHEDGYTIKGVQKVLREQGVKAVGAMGAEARPEPVAPTIVGGQDAPQPTEAASEGDGLDPQARQKLQTALDELKSIRAEITKK